MMHFKKIVALAAVGAAVALASAPAMATAPIAVTLSPTDDGGYFGGFSAPISKGKPFTQSFTFADELSGPAEISYSVSFGTITGASFDGTAFTGSPYDYSAVLGASHTITFTGLGSPTHSGGGVGGTISISPPVPEPASWALMIGGVGFIGGAMRRRSHRDAGKLALA